MTPGDDALRVDARARVTRRQAKKRAGNMVYQAVRRAAIGGTVMSGVRTVIVFANGQIAVCDGSGRQIPELQGSDSPERRAEIAARSDAATEWLEGSIDPTSLQIIVATGPSPDTGHGNHALPCLTTHKT